MVELDVDGRPISTLSLLRGMHGLKRSVPQAEGLAMDEAGELYLVPALFLVAVIVSIFFIEGSLLPGDDERGPAFPVLAQIGEAREHQRPQ